jgi:hypothetical protein
MPNASAAPDTSPTTCGPPGSGASATGLPRIPARSPSAATSAKRGMRAHPITTANICSHRCQARPSSGDFGCLWTRKTSKRQLPARVARDTGAVKARAAATTLALLSLLALSACGGGDDDGDSGGSEQQPAEQTDIPGDADPADVAVIKEWSDTLRAGDVEGAAEFFALPSVVENGPLLRIRTRDDARLFNAALPCGAILVRAETQGDFTTATFELTERPGPGSCGSGTGERAQTSFVIEDGKITQWRRVGIGGPDPPPGEAV